MLMVSALYSTFNLVSGMAIAGDLPSGGVVKSGDIDISQTSESLKVLQKTDKGIIEWQDFSVGRDKSVHFQQPSKTSATLNRVTGDFTSKIAGQITATGQVFLVNPNGILITKDGAINTHGFVASTLDITDDNFNKGNYTFSQESKTGLVENQGNIDVSDGGFVALLGGAVKNTGIVNAHLGKIGFAGGERIVLSFGGNDFLRVEVPAKDLSTIKDANGNPISDVLDIDGKIKADGGMVQLTVATAAKLYRQGVSLGGYVQVNTAVRKNGVIKLNGGDVNLNKNAKIVANNGNVKIDANSLTSSGSVQASQGNISVKLQRGASLNASTTFDVSGKQAGKILFIGGLSAKDKAYRILGSGNFIANSTDGQGGYIDITSHKGLVGLFSGELSAKGTTRGGRIRIGGAFQGGAYDPTTSKLNTKTQDLFVKRWGDSSKLLSSGKTSLGTSVNIDVSASTGKGGTAILWADHTTNNYAKITATGTTGGGSVEISGKKQIDSFGLGRIKAGNGVILLDPKNVVIGAWASGLSQVQKIARGTGVSLNNSDFFGFSLSLSADGTKLAVGAPGDDTGDSNRGAVYLFTISSSGGAWGSGVSQNLKIAHGAGVSLKDGGRFGSSVSLSADGTKLAVGATLDNTGGTDRGAVYLFTISGSGGSWGSGVSRKLKIAHGAGVSLNNGDRFGRSVFLSADGTKISGRCCW